MRDNSHLTASREGQKDILVSEAKTPIMLPPGLKKESSNLLTACKWIGTITGIIGALMLALHIPESGYGYIFFTASSITWGFAAWMMKDRPLLLLQTAFLGVNIIGVWRWLLV